MINLSIRQRLFFISLLGIFIASVFASMIVWNRYNSINEFRGIKKFIEMEDKIVALELTDEYFEQSMRAYTYTGNETWKNRYLKHLNNNSTINISQVNEIYFSRRNLEKKVLDTPPESRKQILKKLEEPYLKHKAKLKSEIRKEIKSKSMQLLKDNEIASLFDLSKQLFRAREIARLDEVLTQSTVNYASTGDYYWKESYDQNGIRLDDVIREALENSSEESSRIFRVQNEANQKLVEMELSVHSLVKQGNMVDAISLIASNDYKKWKTIYTKTISEFLNTTKIQLNNRMKDLKKTNNQMMIILVFIIIVSLLTAILFLLKISRAMISNFEEIKQGVIEYSKDNFTYVICTNGNDEFSMIKEELELMAQKIIATRMKLVDTAKLVSLGQMAGGIAHEINNPLAIISLSLQTLRRAKHRGELDDAMFEENMRDIETTVLRITKIVSGLRSVSRESKGEKNEPIILRDIFEDVLGLCSEKFKNNSVELHINIHLPLFDNKVLGDRIQLSQVFINLIGNAYDAVQELQEKWVKIKLIEMDDIINIQIFDSGKGISTEVQNKMFTPFFTTKDIGKGTGLGLSLSLSMVKSSGGKLEANHTYDNTCFEVKLLKAP